MKVVDQDAWDKTSVTLEDAFEGKLLPFIASWAERAESLVNEGSDVYDAFVEALGDTVEEDDLTNLVVYQMMGTAALIMVSYWKPISDDPDGFSKRLSVIEGAYLYSLIHAAEKIMVDQKQKLKEQEEFLQTQGAHS